MDKTYTDPVCGMSVGADTPHQLEVEGEQYYFCSDKCLQQFEAKHGGSRESGQTTDPVCEMTVPMDSKHHTTYKTKELYFCSASCLKTFNKAPDSYV
ncbi:MAG: YHS domain-containing protein [candidate division Zixibacteria bacterium]|jgi:Cu+-exporting ATPase|nr:YHS domain-containing protein [candidate division Zixibacteria bacterium]